MPGWLCCREFHSGFLDIPCSRRYNEYIEKTKNYSKEKYDSYKDYYEQNMRSVNVASGYSVTLRMLEAANKYDLDYFEKLYVSAKKFDSDIASSLQDCYNK